MSDQWRVELAERRWDTLAAPTVLVADITHAARSKILTRALNRPAELTWTMDGRNPLAALARELETDVIVWRRSETDGADVCYFRGLVDHSEDVVSANRHSVNFTAHDYLAQLGRRWLTFPYNSGTSIDQDQMVASLVALASDLVASDGDAFGVPARIPLTVENWWPDGTPGRPNSGQLRYRQLNAGANILEQLGQLSNVIGGFDYDVVPYPAGSILRDRLRVFYPARGTRHDRFAFQYGTTVSAFTRTVASQNKANYVRVSGADDPNTAAPMWAERGLPEAFLSTADNPAGTWMAVDAFSDVSQLDTLQQKADGIAYDLGTLRPSFSLTLRPGAFREGAFQIGDELAVVAQTGRLHVGGETFLRVVGETFTIGDDGAETVAVDVGRPPAGAGDVQANVDRRLGALETGTAGGLQDVPIGAVFDFVGQNPPRTYRWMDGALLAAATYPELFDVIGYTFGGAGGQFNLPDARGRVNVGAGAGAGLTARTRGQTGGVETTSAYTMARHSHHLGGHALTTQSQNQRHIHTGVTGWESGHQHQLPGTGWDGPDHHHDGRTISDTPQHTHEMQAYGHWLAVQGGPDQYNFLMPGWAGLYTAGVSANHGHDFSSGGASARHTHDFTGPTGGTVGTPHVHNEVTTGLEQLGTGADAYHQHAIGPGAYTDENGDQLPDGNMPPWLAIGRIIRVLPPWRPDP